MAQSRGECPVCLGEGFKIRDVDQCVMLRAARAFYTAEPALLSLLGARSARAQRR
jgi:hypothetical protein